MQIRAPIRYIQPGCTRRSNLERFEFLCIEAAATIDSLAALVAATAPGLESRGR
jgi:hypothetical protein